MTWMKTFLKQRASANRAREQRSGYDYAAGELLRSNGTTNPSDKITSIFDGKSEFDKGILAAERDWQYLENAKGGTVVALERAKDAK